MSTSINVHTTAHEQGNSSKEQSDPVSEWASLSSRTDWSSSDVERAKELAEELRYREGASRAAAKEDIWAARVITGAGIVETVLGFVVPGALVVSAAGAGTIYAGAASKYQGNKKNAAADEMAKISNEIKARIGGVALNEPAAS